MGAAVKSRGGRSGELQKRDPRSVAAPGSAAATSAKGREARLDARFDARLQASRKRSQDLEAHLQLDAQLDARLKAARKRAKVLERNADRLLAKMRQITARIA